MKPPSFATGPFYWPHFTTKTIFLETIDGMRFHQKPCWCLMFDPICVCCDYQVIPYLIALKKNGLGRKMGLFQWFRRKRRRFCLGLVLKKRKPNMPWNLRLKTETLVGPCVSIKTQMATVLAPWKRQRVSSQFLALKTVSVSGFRVSVGTLNGLKMSVGKVRLYGCV